MSDETFILSDDENELGEKDSPVQVAIHVVSGPHQGLRWSFDRETHLVVGRQAPSQLKLPEETAMSREHIALRVQPPRIFLTDLNSSNGTKVNGVQIKSAVLSDGDQFGVGNTLIELEVVRSGKRSGSEPQLNRFEGSAEQRGLGISSNTLNIPPTAEEFRHTRVRPVHSPHVGKREQRLAETIAPSPEQPDSMSAGIRRAEDPVAETIESSLRLGSYQLDQLLGRGGMATVHRAKHLRTGDVVAIKLIRNDAAITQKQVRLFVREAGVLTNLQHPRIVRAIEFGLEETRLYLVMEYINTVSLFGLLDQQSSKQRTQIATWIVTCVLQAVHYAHQQGIVHRDIKPGNLLAYRQGRHLKVKLADFGLAKCYEDAGLSQMTSERSMRGTLAYMAPEQFENARDSGPLVDLFACGACLYHLMLGVLPSVMTNREETMSRLSQAENLPDSLKPIIAKSIAIDPRDRYQTPDAFAQDLYPFHRKKC